MLTQSFTVLPLSLSALPGVLLAIFVPVRRSSLLDWLSVMPLLSGAFMYGCHIKHAHLAPHVTSHNSSTGDPQILTAEVERKIKEAIFLFSFTFCSFYPFIQLKCIFVLIWNITTHLLCATKDQCTQVPSANRKQQDRSAISYTNHRVQCRLQDEINVPCVQSSQTDPLELCAD